MLSESVSKDLEAASPIREMFEKGGRLIQKYGADKVADLTLGNPNEEPPSEFKKSIIRLMGNGHKGQHRYMSNSGYTRTKEAVASHLNRAGYFNGILPEHIVMTCGASGGLNIALKSILNPGEEVMTIKPYFPEYRFYIKNFCGRQVPVEAGNNFTIDADDVEKAITGKTRAIILNSPNNPTGAVYSRKNLEGIVGMLSEKEKHLGREIYIVSDEPYREMIYESEFTSPASLHKNSFMVYSWSKSLGVPGERIGYVAVNPGMKHLNDIIEGLVFSIRTLGFVNAPAMMQNVIPDVIDSEVDKRPYAQMRDKLNKTLNENGYTFTEPKGAFYFWVKCPTNRDDVNPDHLSAEKRFIEHANEKLLLVVPGSSFGEPGWFRLAYVDPKNVDLGCIKLQEIAKRYGNNKVI